MRKRDYAAERARRDAKYQSLGYKNYNQYETQRRNNKAMSQGFKSYRHKRKAIALASRVVEQLDEADYDFELEPSDPGFWNYFRGIYAKGTGM